MRVAISGVMAMVNPTPKRSTIVDDVPAKVTAARGIVPKSPTMIRSTASVTMSDTWDAAIGAANARVSRMSFGMRIYETWQKKHTVPS
jgi:hypothetical protein